MKPLLSINEVSDLLGLPINTLHQQRRRKVGAGALALKVGRHLRWRPEDIESWLDEQSARSQSPVGQVESVRDG